MNTKRMIIEESEKIYIQLVETPLTLWSDRRAITQARTGALTLTLDLTRRLALHQRCGRYPATLRVSVGPIARPTPVWVTRRPTASHEHEIHRLR